VLYVDHAHAVGDAFERLGQDYVTSLYEDGIHTNATGAYIVGQAFVRALKCSNAARAFDLDFEGQKLDPFCSEYGVPQGPASVRESGFARMAKPVMKLSALPVLAKELEEPFWCVALGCMSWSHARVQLCDCQVHVRPRVRAHLQAKPARFAVVRFSFATFHRREVPYICICILQCVGGLASMTVRWPKLRWFLSLAGCFWSSTEQPTPLHQSSISLQPAAGGTRFRRVSGDNSLGGSTIIYLVST
jgi:hypothetical protein